MSGRVSSVIAGAVATITLDNPGQRNALTPEMLVTLDRELGAFTGAGSVRVAVLRGAGEMFSSGYAINRFRPGAEVGEQDEIEFVC
jgi:enoyl-CoA hydratase/carnithine racemase